MDFTEQAQKKSLTSILSKYPKAQPKHILKKKNKNPNTNTRPPQSSNGNAKAKPKIRNPKEKNLIKDNALRFRLKPHHQALRLDAATAPLPETQATELGSALEIGPIGSELAMLTEKESSMYVTPIGSKLATPQGILHFTSLFYLFFSLNL